MEFFSFLRKVSERKTEMSSLLTPRYAAPESWQSLPAPRQSLLACFPISIPKVFGVLGVFLQKHP